MLGGAGGLCLLALLGRASLLDSSKEILLCLVDRACSRLSASGTDLAGARGVPCMTLITLELLCSMVASSGRSSFSVCVRGAFCGLHATVSD